MKTFKIVVVAKNNMDELPQVLTSIDSQSYRNFEVMIVDDASTDESPEFIKAFCHKRGEGWSFRRYKEPKGFVRCQDIGVDTLFNSTDDRLIVLKGSERFVDNVCLEKIIEDEDAGLLVNLYEHIVDLA